MNLKNLNNRLWAIAPHCFAAVQRGLAEAKDKEAFLSLEDFVITRPDAVLDENGTGHVYIQGALGDKMPNIWGMVGNTDYRGLRGDLDAMRSMGADSITLHIDSPGGMVSGLHEAGRAISAASAAGIPVTASVDGMACSAAYYLACQADHIEATHDSEVGNIGTVLAWADDSGFWEAMGVEFHVMTNEGADLKGTFRDSPMTESQREFLQEGLNHHGAEFRAVVEGNRENIDAEVFRAGWYSGEKAVALGLIDTVVGA